MRVKNVVLQAQAHAIWNNSNPNNHKQIMTKLYIENCRLKEKMAERHVNDAKEVLLLTRVI
jgi:hypothetical protein